MARCSHNRPFPAQFHSGARPWESASDEPEIETVTEALRKTGIQVDALQTGLEETQGVDRLLDVATGTADLAIKAVTTSLLSSTGFFQSKESSLKLTLSQNAKNQLQVNERVNKFEANLNARYSALDTKMASLNALNAYVSQQVTTWNKSTG